MRDMTVLKYAIPAIRNSDFLTGNHTCILKYLYFLSLKARPWLQNDNENLC